MLRRGVERALSGTLEALGNTNRFVCNLRKLRLACNRGFRWHDGLSSCSGPPCEGKSHLASAPGFALVENGWRVRSPEPPISSNGCKSPAVNSLSNPPSPGSKYHLLILDDLAYVTTDHAETGVLLELIGAR